VSREADQAGEFEELFRAVYLTFHRRDGPRSQLSGASAAVLEHLALAGPLTIGEAAAHLRRHREVLSEDLLAAALSRMDPDQAAALLGGLRALAQSAAAPLPTHIPGRTP